MKLGKYKHYKGNYYEVIGVAKHSETLEELVVYTHDGQMWARPKKIFLETVNKDGEEVPRFEFVGENE